jgi:hypothetical protein
MVVIPLGSIAGMQPLQGYVFSYHKKPRAMP